MAYISKRNRRREKERQNATKNRRELIEAGFTRRDLMKMGLIGATGMLLPIKGLSARARDPYGRKPLDDPESPPTDPWLEEMPRLQVAQPVVLNPAPQRIANTAAGEAPRADHQRWDEFVARFGAAVTYENIAAQTSGHILHPQLPPQTLFSYNGQVPGPLFHSFYGTRTIVRFRNNLPLIGFDGFGRGEISTHLHNGHTASESDGFPMDFYAAPQYKDHHYPNIRAGYDQFPDTAGDHRETLNTLWYHDHRVDFTAQNTYKGLAGMYTLFDELDNNDETSPPPAFGLPSGEFDVNIVFQDRVFDEDNGRLFFDKFNLDGILGDKFLANGKIQPFFRVRPRKYRFRLLNAGPSRFYQFFIRDKTTNSDIPFAVIANDGNLLPAPVLNQTSVRIAVAERIDIVVDFAGRENHNIILQNRLEQEDGRGPTGDILSPSEAMENIKFKVDLPLQNPDPSRIPAAFRPNPPLEDIAVQRTWRFDRSGGNWTINNKIFDEDEIRATIVQGTAERWVLQNNSGGWEHPVHIHFEEFQMLTRNGNLPPPVERGRKDVARLGRNETIRLFMRFRDFVGRYPMHCHNTIHEDHAMMLRWDIVHP
jgi:FtsP/CotA-like multicopper oxidase with cupredoxin domain